MTSRGSQSVSPPAQIPQQRHVNSISSSTPPPQPYYPGPASALSQGAFDYLPQAQNQPFIPYQAYGSALSDARGQPGGRGGPPQQNVQQGGNFYQQPGQNIRPQQTQQSHTYFISTQPQNRPPRPTHQSTSQMVFIPQNFTPRNNVITISAANMYPSARVPVFQPYVPGAPYPTNIVYYQNGAPSWQGQGMAPTPAAAIRPQVIEKREKRVLSIQDPDTGRDITQELLNSRSHSTSAEEHPEEVTSVNQNDKEICQTFTRLVADRLKSPDDSNTSGSSSEPLAAVSATPASTPGGSVSTSQQYQQPPPQQQVQQQPASIAPATMMRPPPFIPPHSGMIQQPPTSATPSHDIQHQVLNVNLSMPPPQFSLRQPTPTIYNAVPQQQQQQQHHAPRQPPQQQQSVRPQMPPVIAPSPQQVHMQPQPLQSAQSLPSSTTIESTVPPHKVETSVPDKQKPQVEATSQNDIPAKPAGQPASTPASTTAKQPSPVKEVPAAQTVEVLVKPVASVKTAAVSEETNISKNEDSVKVETPHGGSQVKDGRKGKKGKKDFICKEIGGTDMDAFIDPETDIRGNKSRRKTAKKPSKLPFSYSTFPSVYDQQSPQKTSSNQIKTSVGSESVNPLQDRSESASKKSAPTSANNAVKRDPKNPWKIQPAPSTTVIKDTQTPPAPRGREPAKLELPVSTTTSVKEGTGLKESSNPWKIIPVRTVETSVSKPKDSQKVKTVPGFSSTKLDDKNKRTVVSFISNAIGHFKMPSTLPDAVSHKSKSVIPSLVTSVHNGKCETSQHPQKSSSKYSSNQNFQVGNKHIPKTSFIQVPNLEAPELPQNQEQTVYAEPDSSQKGLLMPSLSLSQCLTHNKTSTNSSHNNQKVSISVLPANIDNYHESKKSEALATQNTNDLALATQQNHSLFTHITSSLQLDKSNETNYDSSLKSASSTASETLQPASQSKVNTALEEVGDEKLSSHRKLKLSAIPEQDEAKGQGLNISQMTLDMSISETVFEVDGSNSGAGENNMTRTNNALEVTSEADSLATSDPPSSSGHSLPNDTERKQETITVNHSQNQSVQSQASVPVTTGVPLDRGYSRDDSPNPQKSQEQQKPAIAATQVESKHKQKKKKKKGRKTPPNQKVKSCTSSNDTSETSSQLLFSACEFEKQKEGIEVDEKAPILQPVGKVSSDKTAVQDIKTPPTSIPDTVEAPKPTLRESAPQPTPTVQTKPTPAVETKPTPTVQTKPTPAVETKPTPTVQTKPSPAVETKPTPTVQTKPTPAVEPKPTPTVQTKPTPTIESKPTPAVQTKPTQPSEAKVNKAVAPQKESNTVVEVNPAADTTVSAHTKHESQPTKQVDNRVEESNLRSTSSKPLENGIPDIEPVTNNVADDSPIVDSTVINDKIKPAVEKDTEKGETHGTNNEVVSPSSPTETVLVRVKRATEPEDLKEKLHYDRAYLMELRKCASSQTKPDGLPNLEIILDRPVISMGQGPNPAPLDFTPAFFQPSGNQRHAPQISKTNSRNRPRSDAQMPQRVIKSVSLQDSVKPLHQSEKPWKATPKHSATGEAADKLRTLESGVLFIMNRLTPTNFERLAGEMKKLNIKTYENLQELVNIFFDKVTMETKFVEAYANLCKVMCGLKVLPPANSPIKENQATFRVVMLTKCQQEFEADKTMVFEDPEEKRKKMESELPEAPERQAQIENTLYRMKIRRLKFYGNIRFIGELFKLGMLTENIMHDCIYRLLKARDDDSLVSLCNLITTVGQALDTDKAKTRMDQYFTQMAKIAEERKSRIKFTLKDAIDMRSNNWVPRKEQTGPKKIDEVHKDFQEEQATKQFLQSQPLPPRSDTQQSNSRRGSRQRQDENKVTDDGWNTVGSKSLRIDASKMKLSKNVVDENSIQLGPGGGMKQFSMWSRGSYGGSQTGQTSQDNDRSAAPTNRFSALRGEEDRRSYQRSPSRGDGASRSLRGPTPGHGRGKILARSSQEGERRDALASARSIVGGRSQNSSRDNSWNREERRHIIGPRGSRESENQMTRSDIILRPSADSLMPPPAVSPLPAGIASTGVDESVLKKVKPLSKDEMGQKAKTILEEYLSVMDLEEAKLCLRELRGQEHLPLFVTASINEVLERSSKERDLTGSFFHEMIKGGQIPLDVYLTGLSEVLQFAEEMVIDIPMMWTYLAQMIVPMLLRGSLLWSSLPAALKPFLGGKCSAKLLVEILLLAKEKTSEGETALMWQSNNLNWTTFLNADEVDKFLKEKKVEFTVSQVAASASRVSGSSHLDLQKVADDIEGIVRGNGTSEDIFVYIDKRFPVGTHDKHFIRAVVTGLINVSISAHTMKFNEDVIKTHKSVLQRCIKSTPELELQALYAIQALMHKLEHPSGVVATIFDLLYDEDIISEETFKHWEKTTDPQEVEGKGACSMQLTQFFTWLRENEEPETS